MIKKYLKKLKTAAITSLALFIVVAVLSTLIISIVLSRLALHLIFNANFFVAVIIIIAGMVAELWPVRLKKSKLIDHTTHIAKVLEERAIKREKAMYLILMGTVHLLITGIIQLILSFIIQ
jgi:MFS family permease